MMLQFHERLLDKSLPAEPSKALATPTFFLPARAALVSFMASVLLLTSVAAIRMR